MVSSGQGQNPTKPSQGVLYLLQRSCLMNNVQCVYLFKDLFSCFSLLSIDSGAILQITSSGFQFLLHSPHDQLWNLLLQYLHMAEVRSKLLEHLER